MAMRGLYGIVDPEQCTGPVSDPLAFGEQLLRGGCAALQLRAKQLSDTEFADLARGLNRLCQLHNVPFFVNDRVHLVIPTGAAGVHLGQEDMDVRKARAQLGNRLIGLSTHNLNQIRVAAATGVDLIGFGPVFSTSTKQNADPVVGLSQLQQACLRSPVPVVAIGGINLANAAEVATTGTAMVAMISSLARSADPRRDASYVHRLCGGAAPSNEAMHIH